MKFYNPLSIVAATLLLGHGTATLAASDENAAIQAEEAAVQAKEAALQAEEAALQEQLEAEYNKALSAAEENRQVAETAMLKAREQMQLANEQNRKATKESARARAAQQAEMEKMHEELNQARRQLRETSREIARVNREVSRARSGSHSSSFVHTSLERPVIGVILGDTDDVGVKVLGVSPDGPSERAGIEKGDTIIAIGGRVLAAVDEASSVQTGLKVAMRDIRAGEPVIVSVERGDQTLDLTVVPEIREPLTWKTVTRFPSAPSSPGEVIRIESIEIPEIDTEAITVQIEKMRTDIEKRRAQMEAGRVAPLEDGYEFEFHDMSEMGDFALHDANVWFGLPLAQGLKLAEINPGLGEYFKTDRGVLVLKARDDNDLQLESGDVILQVGDAEVNSPAEFMRALREFESGQELSIDIKRDRKNRTLNTVMPESRTSFFAPESEQMHTIRITRDTDH